MPANLTPQYRSAEQEFKSAATTEEKIRCLERMIALLPKHKGTDHLYGDLKRRLSKLRQQDEKKAGRQGVSMLVPREGAAQVAVIGAPNVGKSQLVASFTNAKTAVAEYPFTTRAPMPGMMPYKDIQIQLVDTSPVTAEFMDTWLPDSVRRADMTLVVVDLSTDAALEQADTVLTRLETMRIILAGALPPEEERDPRNAYRRAMLIGNKADLPGAVDRMDILRELFGERLPLLAVSAAQGDGLEVLRQEVFDRLRLVRVYTHVPGKKDDQGVPFALPAGSTVLDLAEAVHKELAARVIKARIWGAGVYDGQFVKLDHVLADGDMVELHE